MKILLLGKTGLLGQALFSALNGKHDVISPSREECDVTKIEQLGKIVLDAKPDAIINATGYTDVDGAESHKTEAYALNSDAVKNLAEIAKAKGVPLMNFSTDYVFDGMKKDGYAEADSPSPISVYGTSKAAGEKYITEHLEKYYLVRTAWLYGPGAMNFVDKMLELAKTRKTLEVVNDQTGNPTYTLDLAEACVELLEGKPYGIYHIVNSGQCTWFEFACEIFNQLGVPQEIIPINSEKLKRPAKRPKYSILKNTRFKALRHWKDALKSYLSNKTFIL